MTRTTRWHLLYALPAIAVVATLPHTIEFRRWLLDMLPLLVLLACCLAHLVRHRHHVNHRAHAGTPSHAMRDEPAVALHPAYVGRASPVPTATRRRSHA